MLTKLAQAVKIPESYTIIDFETTGFSKNSEHIIQVGVHFVVDRVLQEDRGLCFLVDHENLKIGEGAFKVHGISVEMVKKSGLLATDIFEDIRNALQASLDNNIPIMGHNIISFDIPFFEAECKKYNVKPLQLAPNDIFDSGLYIVGAQLGIVPAPGTTYKEYFQSVAPRKRQCSWSLSKHCMEEYGLAKLGADANKAHDALYDCYLVYLLIEELRRRADGTGQHSTGTDAPTTEADGAGQPPTTKPIPERAPGGTA